MSGWSCTYSSSSWTGSHLDDHPAAVGHRVAGVDGQVDQHLLELPGVDLDRQPLLAEVRLQGDSLAERPAQKVLEVGYDVAQVEHLGLDDLAAAEDQQLTGQRGRPFGGLLDLFDVGEGR